MTENDFPTREADEVLIVMSFRDLVSRKRHAFALQCILADGRNVIVEFPEEGAVYLEAKLQEAFERHPEMRTWVGPKSN